ncbi:MAG TPA: hypothetical protein VF783_25330 [Terriglobales bacterium]
MRKGTDVKDGAEDAPAQRRFYRSEFNAHSMSEDRVAAQVDMLTAMMTSSNTVN